jgi:mannose-6-phosphate isomerase-like protein (cupin superfamily)
MKNTPLALLIAVSLVPFARAEPAPAAVVVFDHTEVAHAFAQGLPLTANDSYKISAGRRVAPGNVEIHEHDTDIFYVQEGAATFVTGGTAVDAKPIGPGEIRGTSIAGGTARHLVKGDIIVIPQGTPHQFTEVDGTFLYFVVKVTK